MMSHTLYGHGKQRASQCLQSIPPYGQNYLACHVRLYKQVNDIFGEVQGFVGFICQPFNILIVCNSGTKMKRHCVESLM